MAFNPTPQQRLAIDNRGALLVSAAAGSGKTAVLVERVIQCILDPKNPVDVDKMLVVTFTNAAAAEMKERIGKRLAEEYEKDPGNIRLLKQQMLLNKASISTIDSFCKTLITRHFDRLELSPDFKLISQNNLKVIKKAAMEETLNFFFETRKQEVTALAEAVGAQAGTANLETALETVYSYIRSLPFPALWTDKVCRQYDQFTRMEDSPWGQVLFLRAEQQLRYGLDGMKRALDWLRDDPVVLEKRGDSLRGCMAQWERTLDIFAQRDWDKAVAACRQLENISFQTSRLPKGYESPGKELTGQAKAISESVNGWLWEVFSLSAQECAHQCRQLAPLIGLLMEGVWEYSRRIDQKKKELGSLDFADLEYAALSLLVRLEEGKPLPTREAKGLWEEYQYVMVDEYQDVNDLQSEIFKAISDSGRNLFAVGDVKQSIYRFRKANPKNFLSMLEEYPSYDGACSPGKVILDGNFRSRPGICNTVNHFFSMMMSRQAGEIDYDQTHFLNAKGNFPQDNGPAVGLEFLNCDDQRTRTELEADRIAALIGEAMSTPCVTEGDTLRPATPGDCVILLRGVKNKAELYVNRLRAHGIPAVAEQADGFFERPEVARLISVLRAVDNPTDDVALLGCMMSPLFAFTADELAAIRGAQVYQPLYLSVQQAAEEGNQKAAGLLEALQNLRAVSSTLSAAGLLGRLYHQYGYLSAVQVMENGGQCRQNLLTLMELAEECADTGYDRLDGFLRFVDKLEQQGDFAPPSAAVSGQAVRVMTIHHSKGLQFPLCFVAGCGSVFNRMDSAAPLLLDEKLGVGLTLTDDRLRVRTQTCMRLAVSEETERAGLSEELRVLYVAMTRAVDRLYMMTTFQNLPKKIAGSIAVVSGDENGTIHPQRVLDAGSYGQLLLYFALRHAAGGVLRGIEMGYIPTVGQAEECQVGMLDSAQIQPPRELEDTALAFPAEEEMVSAITRRLSYQDPNAPLQNLFSKRSVSQLVSHGQPEGERTIPRPSFMQEGGLSPAEKGTALHNFMQYADYAAAAADPKRELSRLVEQRFLTQKQGDSIRLEKVAAFFADPLYARMAASPRVMRERRFLSAVPATRLDPTLPAEFAREQVVVQGITDCVFEEDDGLVIVDYKTDFVTAPEELAQRYGDQLRMYALMLEEAEQKPVKELILYSFSLGCQVAVTREKR